MKGRSEFNIPIQEAREPVLIPIEQIRVVESNNMRAFPWSEKDIQEKAQSIASNGIIQPLLVRPLPVPENGFSYDLVAGFGRIAGILYNREHKIADLRTVPCLIETHQPVVDAAPPIDAEFIVGSDRTLLLLNLHENLDHKTLSLIDAAYAIRRLEADGMIGKEIAKEMNRSEGWVSTVKRFADLRQSIQRGIHDSSIPYRVAKVLVRMTGKDGFDEPAQDKLLAEITATGNATKKADAAVSKLAPAKQGRKAKKHQKAEKSGLSAKQATKLFTEFREEIKVHEKPSKAEQSALSVYQDLTKLLAGAMTPETFHRRLLEAL